jgi:hypothetical protein
MAGSAVFPRHEARGRVRSLSVRTTATLKRVAPTNEITVTSSPRRMLCFCCRIAGSQPSA